MSEVVSVVVTFEVVVSVGADSSVVVACPAESIDEAGGELVVVSVVSEAVIEIWFCDSQVPSKETRTPLAIETQNGLLVIVSYIVNPTGFAALPIVNVSTTIPFI